MVIVYFIISKDAYEHAFPVKFSWSR